MATENDLRRVDSRNAGEAVQEDGCVQKNVAAPESFRYTPLEDNSKRIRLCEVLLPGSRHGPLTISLKEHALDAVADQFDALSYVCGDPAGPKSPVILNGKRHTINRNLRTQLCRILELDWNGMIWVDALSIDQTNDIERSVQVNLMNRIYGGAREVFIGVDNETMNVRRAAEEHAIVASAIHALAAERHVWELDTELLEGKPAELSGTLVRSMCRLLGSEWFSRVWCVQEVCLAKKATLLIGSGSLPWETFTSAIGSWRKHREMSCCSPFVGQQDAKLREAFHEVFNHVTSIRNIKAAFNSERGLHILDPMLCFQGLDVTQPVDKFNGYRGLHSMAAPLPDAGYSSRPEDFFEEVAVWSLQVYGDLTPLMLELKGEISANMSSWIPDWSAKPAVQINYWRWRILFYRAYTCSTGIDRPFEYLAPGRLLVHGFEVETVESVAPITFELSSVGCAADHVDVMKKWFSFATGRDCPENGSGVFDDDIFCETILGGLVRIDRKPFVRKTRPADFAQWRYDMAEFERSTAAGLFHTPLIESHVTAVVGRVMFKTNTGSIAIGPSSTEPGDVIWVWNHGRSPFLTRPVLAPQSSEQQQILIGHCYHHALNNGRNEVTYQQSSCVLV